jgi:hypothetical protein
MGKNSPRLSLLLLIESEPKRLQMLVSTRFLHAPSPENAIAIAKGNSHGAFDGSGK